MESSGNINLKLVCQYCHSNIKSREEMLTCPECRASYHIECWYENEGCGVYGCKYKIKKPLNRERQEVTVEELLINAEYLINLKKYVEALEECRRILNADKTNSEAKKFYNRIITLINTKTRLIESGDAAFQSSELKTAEIYFREALKYTDESDTDLLNAKLQIIKEKYPRIIKRKRIKNLITGFISAAILGAVFFLLYYYVYQREHREFSKIENGDYATDVSDMERQLLKYEKFAREFKDGELYNEAREKVNKLAITISKKVYKEDWRIGYKYLMKIDTIMNLKIYKDLKNLILKEAKDEYANLYEEAKELNKGLKFSDAKIILEKAIALIELFPDEEFRKDKQKISSAITLMNKKQSAGQKINEIDREIKEKEIRLDELRKTRVGKAIEISATVKEVKSSSLSVIKLNNGSKIAGLRTSGEQFYTGEMLTLECLRDGSVTIEYGGEEITIPLYVPVYSNPLSLNSISSLETESILLRLKYLKEQKIKFEMVLSEQIL